MTTVNFKSVVIIYNPNSTGDSKQNAKELEKRLKKALPKMPIKSVATKYAGHAEVLACNIAKSRASPLIVSSSGDGGYNEVINGVMSSGTKSKSVICTVLPSGNANDHSRTMQKDAPLWRSIVKGKVTKIDLLKISIESSGKKQILYAHSYIGLGLTPVVAVELNRHTLNAFREIILVVKTFYKYRPFKIRRGNRTIKLDSLIFANINQMAKVLSFSEKNKPADGRFDVIAFSHAHKLLLIRKIFMAVTSNLKSNRRESEYSFISIKKIPIQLDGEVRKISGNSKVQVTAVHKALKTIL